MNLFDARQHIGGQLDLIRFDVLAQLAITYPVKCAPRSRGLGGEDNLIAGLLLQSMSQTSRIQGGAE